MTDVSFNPGLNSGIQNPADPFQDQVNKQLDQQKQAILGGFGGNSTDPALAATREASAKQYMTGTLEKFLYTADGTINYQSLAAHLSTTTSKGEKNMVDFVRLVIGKHEGPLTGQDLKNYFDLVKDDPEVKTPRDLLVKLAKLFAAIENPS